MDKREELKWKWERSPRGEDEEERSCEKGWVSEERTGNVKDRG